jgi:hypothetical protein
VQYFFPAEATARDKLKELQVAQVFSAGANIASRISIVGLVLLLGVVALASFAFYRSPYVTEVGFPIDQPVAFSHKHHVEGLGIDCRYCHTSVEESSFAGIPPTHTCMSCHSQVWTEAPMLEPVRESWATGEPLEWIRVNDTPDFVYFNHSIHVEKGVGCVTCHGRVDQMPLAWKGATLHMQWCLECHRNPEEFIRPKEEVFNMEWEAPANQTEVGLKLVEEYGIRVGQLTNCSICHR